MEEKTAHTTETPTTQRIHLFVSEGEMTYLTEEEFIYRTQEDKQAQEQVVIEPDHTVSTTQLAPRIPKRPQIALLVPSLLLLAHLSILLAVFFADVLLLLTQTVTITIVPKSRTVTTTLTLTTVQNRLFSPVTFSQTKTAATTGKGHQRATQARGLITFYNAATMNQTIDAGELLVGADGIQVVTDQPITIPAATPPTEGQAAVTAHALNVGAQGNIAAHDIGGACCRDNVFAYNSPFHGGQAERDYHTVTQADIDGVVASLLPPVTQSITPTLQKQVHPTETLISPQCSEHTVADHRIGDEARTVTVTVKKTCRAGAYQRQDFQAKLQQALSQQTLQSVGKEYVLSAYLQTTPLQTTIQHGTLFFVASYQATVIYHFTSQALHAMRALIAGKSNAQAIQILSHISGIEHVTITGGNNASTLPLNQEHIHLTTQG
ncbi:MAG TPA: baseplate J/gp47 family protein [Ktedonobacteraceae bacterium]|nr:baseplate J/gp47 family protein [Ktedonobacteraceae bacterium]